jgi:hypothetical protein
VATNAFRVRCRAATVRSSEMPLAHQSSEMNRAETERGVAVLDELRRSLGTDKFCDMMDSFGRENAGKKVTTEAFEKHVAQATRKKLGDFLRDAHVLPDGLRSAIQAFDEERDKTLIVYGTGDEEAANRNTATALQEAIRAHWSNEIVHIKADKDISDEELRTHHLLLIGRPTVNRIVERFRDYWPVTFGSQSFSSRGETFAHPNSAVLTAAGNPLNSRYSAVVLAGLSAEATTRTVDAIYRKDAEGADVIILPNQGKTKAFVAPKRELEKQLRSK